MSFVVLRLGSELGSPHSYRCGSLVDATGTHGLVCKHVPSGVVRHHVLNLRASELSLKITDHSGEPLETQFLFQRVSVLASRWCRAYLEKWWRSQPQLCEDLLVLFSLRIACYWQLRKCRCLLLHILTVYGGRLLFIWWHTSAMLRVTRSPIRHELIAAVGKVVRMLLCIAWETERLMYCRR